MNMLFDMLMEIHVLLVPQIYVQYNHVYATTESSHLLLRSCQFLARNDLCLHVRV